MVKKRIWSAMLLSLVITGDPLHFALVSSGQAEPADTLSQLKKLDLEDLAKTEVTSVSRKSGSVLTAPAAITVLSSEDLRRSAAENVAEALRLVPGMEVGRIDSSSWALTARGFNSGFANKLLVLLDGRSVYTPLFAGVYWDVQNPALEDLDRIEVIRGPGSTLWGANAVNGVVNIMSKPASETQGLMMTGETGTLTLGRGRIRYGGKIKPDLHYRVYGEYSAHESSRFADGSDVDDEWQYGQFGFRTDWTPQGPSQLTVQGDFYAASRHDLYTVASPLSPFTENLFSDSTMRGANLLARWTRTYSDQSDLRIQTYWDHTYREGAVHRETRETFDLDLQHRLPLGEHNDVVWGSGFRTTSDDTLGSYAVSMNPRERRMNLLSLFVQDEISLLPDKLTLTLGSKFEYQNQTGLEIQPNARVSWLVTPKNSLWASVSRAVRSPSRADTDLIIHQPGPVVFPPGSTITLTGNPDLDSEVLMAYEIGYRFQPLTKLSLDLTAYYHDYDNLIASAPAAPIFGSPILIDAVIGNGAYGETYGSEFAASWQATPQWRLQGSVTALQIHSHSDPIYRAQVELDEGSSPQFQWALRSWLNLPAHFEFDSQLQWVDRIQILSVPAHLDLALRLGWRPTDHVEVSVGVKNLLDNQHLEFPPSALLRTRLSEIPRTIYAKLTLRW